MKKIITFLALATIFACSQKKEVEENTTLELTLLNSTSTTVYLATSQENKLDTIGFADLVDGKASIAYELEEPQLTLLFVNDIPQPQFIYANTDGFKLELDFAQTPVKLVSEGNELQDKFLSYQELEMGFSADYQGLQALSVQAQSDQVLAQLLEIKYDSMITWFEGKVLDFCMQGEAVGALIAAQRLPKATYKDLNAVYQNINVQYSSAPDVIALKKKMEDMKRTAIGEPYLEFSAKDTSGTVVNIADIQKESKIMMIDFWASWCKPCRDVNPALVAVYNDYHDRGFEIVGVSLDEKLDEWKQAIVDDKITWPQMNDLVNRQSEIANQYGVSSIPQSIIINQYGVIVIKDLNEEDLRAYLEENL